VRRSVASHEISNRCIWLLEDAARSSPLTADDRAWRDRGRGVRWNADDEGQAGKLWRPWHSTRQILCMTAPELMPRVTAVWTDRSGDLGEPRSGYHDNAKGDIRGYIK